MFKLFKSNIAGALGWLFTGWLFIAGYSSIVYADGVVSSQPLKKSVKVMALKKELRTIPIGGSGRIAHDEIRALSFKVAGFIQSMAVRDGDYVKQGQLLAVLDQREIDARLRKSKSSLDNSRRDYQRLRALKKRKLVSDDLVDRAVNGLASAQADWDIVSYNSKHSKIYAPADGVVVSRFLDPGEFVSTGQSVIEMAPTDKGWILRFGLSDREVDRIRLGGNAAVYIDAWNDVEIAAQISKIDSRASQQPGIFEIEVTLELPINDMAKRLRAGYFAQVKLFPRSPKKLYFLPLHSLVDATATSAEVMLVDEHDLVHRKTVKIKHLLNDEVAVDADIDPQQRLVIEGGQWLRPGDSVIVPNDYKLASR